MTSKADLEEVIRKRIAKLKNNKDGSPEKPSDSPETHPDSDPTSVSDKQDDELKTKIRRLKRAKDKKMNGYVKKGGGKRGK